MFKTYLNEKYSRGLSLDITSPPPRNNTVLDVFLVQQCLCIYSFSNTHHAIQLTVLVHNIPTFPYNNHKKKYFINMNFQFMIFQFTTETYILITYDKSYKLV